jgi:hypothetical protein
MDIKDSIFFLEYYIKYNCDDDCMLAIASKTLIEEYKQNLKIINLEVSNEKR